MLQFRLTLDITESELINIDTYRDLVSGGVQDVLIREAGLYEAQRAVELSDIVV